MKNPLRINIPKKSDFTNPRLRRQVTHSHFPPVLQWVEGIKLSEDIWL